MQPDQLEHLQAYQRLLLDRAVPAGLVSRNDAPFLWDRHILDSLRALRCLAPTDQRLVDLGSGAGLPGIPLAIARPDLVVALIERQRRRVAFLETVVMQLHLDNTVVLPRAIEDETMEADVCTARALADPSRSWQLALRCLSPGGKLIYFAGSRWRGAKGEARTRTRGEAGTLSEGRSNGVEIEICSPGEFPWQGPLVIMRRIR